MFPGTTVSPISSGNTITIDYSAGTDPVRVFGGISSTESTAGNRVTLKNGATDRIYGGYTLAVGEDSSGNAVIVESGGTVTTAIAGGLSSGGDAMNNSVLFSSTSAIAQIQGGSISSSAGVVSGNKVGILSGTIAAIYGGVEVGTGTGTAADNEVVIDGSSVNVTGWTYGGYTSNSGDVTYNKVVLRDGTAKYLTGGYSDGGGDVNFNSVSIYGGQTDYVVGGNSKAGDAANNSVTMYDGTVSGLGHVYGGFVGATGRTAENNTVTLHGGTMANVYGAGANTTVTDTTINNNTVILAGDTVNVSGWAIGGYSRPGGTAESNQVVVKSGMVGNVGGGFAQDGDVIGNTARIEGGLVTGDVYGGRTWDNLDGGSSGNATGNAVIISGGELRGNVYGGGAQTDTSGNTVSLSGAANLSAASLFGANTADFSGTHSGNTLEIHRYAGTSVKGIGNFETYDFLIPTSLASGGAALSVTDASDISNSVINVNFIPDGNALRAGDQIILINDAGALTSTGINTGTQARQGALLVYDLDISSDPNNVRIGVRSGQAAPESKSVSAGRIASLAFLNQGHDLIVDSGFDAANAYLGRTGDGWSTPAFFGSVGGGHFRHKTGSHVDVDGISTLLGLAWRNNGPCGSLLLGAFFEAGYADYDTRNAFASGTVRGDGDSRYFGGGFMARYDWQSGLYVEATGRAGGVKNKFHSDLADVSGNRAKYDINSPYFGAHAGVGYKWRINGKALFDLSTKYLWSRQNGDSAVVTGNRVNFGATNSHRVRTGARFAYAVNDCIAPYLGAAFEYEFNGKAKGAVSSYNFGVPSLKGGTGIGEIGLTMRRNSFSADFGIQGHVGRRDGVSGSLRVGWTF